LVVPLAVVDVTAQAAKNADYQLSRQDLADWEKKHGRLPGNCCVAMNSGWAQHAGNAAKFVGKDSAGVLHFPGFAPEAAEWLLKERRVVGLAVDTVSLDHGPSKDFKTHYLWLPTGRWGIESIANLDRVPATGATLVVGLVKIKDATGGHARIFALL
jgi:kynurenine formamidase